MKQVGKELVYIPETPVEMHYFKQLRIANGELKNLRVEHGKATAYIDELEHNLSAARNTLLKHERTIERLTKRVEEMSSMLREGGAGYSERKQIGKLKKVIQQRDSAISKLLSNTNDRKTAILPTKMEKPAADNLK